MRTELERDAADAAGKGKALSKAEQNELQPGVLLDAARALRRDGVEVVRLDAWVDAAVTRVTEKIDQADKPGRGHGKISLSEARNASLTYNDVGPRIAKALELLTGKSLEATESADPVLAAAVRQTLRGKNFGIFQGLGDVQASTWAQAKMESALCLLRGGLRRER